MNYRYDTVLNSALFSKAVYCIKKCNNDCLDLQQAVVTRQSGTVSNYVAPISGESIGIKRAEIKQGVREVILCKGSDGKVGVRFQAISKVGKMCSKLQCYLYTGYLHESQSLVTKYFCHFGVNFLFDVMEFKEHFTPEKAIQIEVISDFNDAFENLGIMFVGSSIWVIKNE